MAAGVRLGRPVRPTSLVWAAVEDMLANFDVITSEPLSPAQRRAVTEARQSVIGFACGVHYPFLLQRKER